MVGNKSRQDLLKMEKFDESMWSHIIKPCYVKLESFIRDISKLYVINDADRIIPEVPNSTSVDELVNGCNHKSILVKEKENQSCVKECSISTDTDTESDGPTTPDIEAEIPLDDASQEKHPGDDKEFYCIFCKAKIDGFLNATRHYQIHLECYPYKCSICLEALTSMPVLFTHFRSRHPTSKLAIYKKFSSPHTLEWIQDFLRFQTSPSKIIRVSKKYCPVCDIICKPEEIQHIPSNFVSASQLLMHIWRHLRYEPYVCLECEAVGKRYCLSRIDSTAYDHIFRRHENKVDSLLTETFERKRGIANLDKFIRNYIISHGIKPITTRDHRTIPILFKTAYSRKKELEEKNSFKQVEMNGEQDKETSFQAPLPDRIPNTVTTTVGNSLNTSTHFRFSQSLILAPSTQSSGNEHNYSQISLTKSLLSSQTSQLDPTHPLVEYLAKKNNFNQKTIKTSVSAKVPVPDVVTIDDEEDGLENANKINRDNVNHNSNGKRRPQKNTEVRPQNTEVMEVTPLIPGVKVRKEMSVAIKDVENEYYCVFCRIIIKPGSKLNAGLHFLKHLEYKPLICLICSASFTIYEEIIRHFFERHGHDKVCSNGICETLLYYTRHDENLESWIEDHLNSQISGSISSLSRQANVNFCPLCHFIENPNGGTSKPGDDEKSIHDHIYLHFSYKPFFCVICKRVGKITKFSSLGASAAYHVAAHGYTFSDHNLLKIFFYNEPILALERFINEFLLKNFYPVARTKVVQPSPTVPTSSNVSVTRVSKVSKLPNVSNYSITTRKKTNKKLTNLAKQITNKSSLWSRIPPELLPKSTCDNLQSESPREVYVCYHCHTIYESISKLREHHGNMHSTLSFVSYPIFVK